MANENKPDAQMPQLAYRNLRFLESADARALRILSEYFDPLAHLRKAGVQHTVVFFGSARILPREAAVQKSARGGASHQGRSCGGAAS